LVAQLILLIEGFVRIGLVESHAIFACYPLLVALLATLVLGGGYRPGIGSPLLRAPSECLWSCDLAQLYSRQPL